MSISSVFHNAMSGLTAASRSAEIVSENIANATTQGYARRSLVLTSDSGGGSGVRIAGVQRIADPVIIANRRQSEAIFGSAEALSGFYSRYESLVGTATDSRSISMRLTNFESSLIEASSLPESLQRLDAVAAQAGGLAQGLADASEGLRSLRTQADQSIALQVDRLNQALADVQELNIQITATYSRGQGTAGLMDHRQLLLDEINQIVPINIAARDHGQIALYTDGGAILLDGPAVTVNFTPVNNTMPGMSIENGALSGLEINGIAIRSDSKNGALRGGTLAAQFQIRDELAVTAQADLDAMARDLIERYETTSLDPTQIMGDPGLFTDAGAAYDPLNEVGLAGRLTLNAAVDPQQGGESWRLRAGLGAIDPGATGESRQLQAFAEILNERRTIGSGTFGTGQLTASGLASSLMSQAAYDSAQSYQSLTFAASSLTELSQIELAQGVDTDAELQALMIIEQAFAANARIIEAADEMMQAILRI